MKPTPLLPLSKVAAALNVKHVLLKDEGKRLGLKAFKGAGVGFAIDERIKALGHDEFFKNGAETTITTMTDGNHGRAVANYSKKVGAKCVIFVPKIMSSHRRQAIEDEGAEVVVVDGDYDDSIDEVVAQATAKGWHMILDTAFEGYTTVPSDIVSGYGGTIFEEVSQQLARDHPTVQVTHIVLCAGVGSFASSGAMFAYNKIKDQIASGEGAQWAPSLKFLVVEPGDAACMLENAKVGHALTHYTILTMHSHTMHYTIPYSPCRMHRGRATKGPVGWRCHRRSLYLLPQEGRLSSCFVSAQGQQNH
jgi:diaminopropionate ammonia-lyase